MQLNNGRSIRQALAVATCTLLGTAPQSGHAADNAENWRVDGSILYYSEQDRVTVIEPVVFARRTFADDSALTLRLVYDSMTGASANGATLTNAPQTFTSPSGTSTYTTPANQTPLHQFSDQRVALAAEWEKPVNRMRRYVYGATISTENDYQSFGLSTTLLQDFNDKLSTFTAGLAGSYDLVQPIGGVPTPMQLLSTVVPSSGGDEGGDGGGKGKASLDGIVGFTQVLTRRLLTQFNYSIGYASGYLTDPYKVLSVINATGATVDYRYESRPDTRIRQSLYWKTVYHLPHDVVHFSYRHYWDDWGVSADTVDLHYRLELWKGSYLQPHVRYATQNAADFYIHSLLNTNPAPVHASADYRLGDLVTTTVGLKFGLPVGKSSELSLRVESMTQSGNSHPADAIGIQKGFDLFPTIHSSIAQLTYTGRF